MSSPFPPDLLLRHVLFPHSMSGFGRSAINTATISSKFSAAEKVNEELDGMIEIKQEVRHFKAKVE